MSSTGVPSTMSVPKKLMVAFSIFSISTKESPMGHGRCGDRVENTPTRSPPRRGGATLALGWALLRWK
ncbi:hypothetical protein M5D96_010022 [Drosophila gunungcola]|uniref:Uncharacterized protein n=1 Tax=Drosophila gunungcola TaxID=103775 RepID=A0A9P9YHW3_9MUSC|nr:hypothetical protein M5D96_010022 [Drosophila gunungcola]